MGHMHCEITKNIIFTLHILSIYFLILSPALHSYSAKGPTQVLHSTHQPRSDARWQHQPDLRGGRLPDALR